MLRHIVMFSFKESSDDTEVGELDKSFKSLPSAISEVLNFESGINISPENLNKGFTHVYELTFADEKARDRYLYHEEHLAFSKKAGGFFQDVLVVDYEV